jgi:hypothetical protein
MARASYFSDFAVIGILMLGLAISANAKMGNGTTVAGPGLRGFANGCSYTWWSDCQ